MPVDYRHGNPDEHHPDGVIDCSAGLSCAWRREPLTAFGRLAGAPLEADATASALVLLAWSGTRALMATFGNAGVERHTADGPSIAMRIAASASAWLTPSIAITLSRPRSPRRIVRQEVRTPSTPASSRHTASFARPSRGGAVTRTMTTPSRSPANMSDRDRGCTRTESVARDIHIIIAEPPSRPAARWLG